jgi:hypothetical protein
MVAKSEVAERFAGWDLLGGFVWARILSRWLEFADCRDWSKLKPLAWRQLLMRQPQFADKCDKWDGMRPFGGACGAREYKPTIIFIFFVRFLFQSGILL